MRTFFRPNEAHISVEDAKKAIREYGPQEGFLDVLVLPDHDSNDPKSKVVLQQAYRATCDLKLDESFLPTCKEVGVEPRWKYNTSVRDYTGPQNDAMYILFHDDFVKVAKRYEVLVGVQQVELQPDTRPQLESAANDAQDGKSWDLKRVQRYHGYKSPLERALKAAKAAGKPCPKAAEILDLWRDNKPVEINQILDSTFDYYTAEGATKACTRKALQQAIDNMVIQHEKDE